MCFFTTIIQNDNTYSDVEAFYRDLREKEYRRLAGVLVTCGSTCVGIPQRRNGEKPHPPPSRPLLASPIPRTPEPRGQLDLHAVSTVCSKCAPSSRNGCFPLYFFFFNTKYFHVSQHQFDITDINTIYIYIYPQ